MDGPGGVRAVRGQGATAVGRTPASPGATNALPAYRSALVSPRIAETDVGASCGRRGCGTDRPPRRKALRHPVEEAPGRGQPRRTCGAIGEASGATGQVGRTPKAVTRTRYLWTPVRSQTPPTCVQRHSRWPIRQISGGQFGGQLDFWHCRNSCRIWSYDLSCGSPPPPLPATLRSFSRWLFYCWKARDNSAD